MGLPESKRLKSAANASILRAKCDSKRLVAFHTAVALVLSLAALAIDFALEQKIGNTGGLSGVGTRSVLETVQQVLQQAQVIAWPFWQVGWLYATVKIARREATDKKDLAEGFRRFPGFLRLMILKALIFFGLALGAAYAASFIVMMLPMSNTMTTMMNPNITEVELMALLEPLMLPLAVISGVLSLALCVPFFYRFRMAEYFLLDNPQLGARAALRGSGLLMRGNMWKLVRLDLSFWWFWLLQLAVSAISAMAVILPLAGIQMPWGAEISEFIAYLLSAVAQLALYYFCKAQLDVTYAHAYLALLPKEEEKYESH